VTFSAESTNKVVLERIGMQNAEGLDGEKEDAKKGRRTAIL
jgi:hypothetical protein